jgi:undecaprenyl diphosphate synthase
MTAASPEIIPPRPELRARAAAALGIPLDRLPRHIAVIMDGNGRWARQRSLPRIAGHHEGANSVRAVITECGRMGIEVLTVYSFSHENWKRPQDEIGALMALAYENLIGRRHELLQNQVRLVHIGRRHPLPPEVLRELDATIAETKDCAGLTVALALNYGSRAEIVDAARALARKVANGALAIDDIDETAFADHLYTTGLPDPDLLIRTAGEYRLSNYLLWQLSYAEIHVTDALWPDFREPHLHAAIRDYASRDRRFGGV